MKVWLDSERVAPEGWTHVRWPDEAIGLLQTGKVKYLSLQHDLGNSDRGTGYGVLLWMGEAVERGFKPPKVSILETDPASRKRMELAVATIYRRYGILHGNSFWMLLGKALRIKAQSRPKT